MQPSMFNLRVPLPARDEVFLMNTLTDAQLLVSSDVAALLDRCVATTNPVGGFRADEWDAFKVLADNGFLVASRDADRRNLDAYLNEVKSGTSDSMGDFIFDGLAEGRYQIEASSPGFQIRTTDPMFVGGSGKATVDVTLPIGPLEQNVSVTAAADGSFETSVLASAGNELRFEALRQGQRSAPADFLYTSDGGDQLSRSPRHGCLTLSPGFDLDVQASGAATLQLQNGCPEPITFASPRFRGGGAFTLDTALPLVIAAGGEGELELRRSAATGAAEDVLFVDATRAAQTLRYPIGLFSQP